MLLPTRDTCGATKQQPSWRNSHRCRAGYLADERRRIERELFGGRLLGVTATSALELGIDVGGLDAALLVGYPGTIASLGSRRPRGTRR